MGFRELQKRFETWLENDESMQYLRDVIKGPDADYGYASAYAAGVSSKWAELLTEEYGAGVVDVIKDSGNMAEIVNTISNAYMDAYYTTADYARDIQAQVNRTAGIGIKAIRPAIDEGRINNLIEELQAESTTERMREHLLTDSALNSVTHKAVADAVQANARAHQKAGLHAYVGRDSGAGCCEWCDSLAGVYEYGEQPRDFWKVHAYCTCSFVYKPSRDYIPVKIRFETVAGKIRKIEE